jgi:hypothetical protein
LEDKECNLIVRMQKNNIANLEEETRYFGGETSLFWGRNNAKIALKNPRKNSVVLPQK